MKGRDMTEVSALIEEDLEHILASCECEFEEMKGQSLLITGGAGFLGYYFVKTILHWNSKSSDRDKIRLYVLDNFIRGKPRWLTELQEIHQFRVFDQSILDPLPDIFDELNYIIHAASIASPIFYRKNPIATMDANVNGLRSILDSCISTNGKITGILYFSTSEIYGDPSPDQIPTRESYRGNVSCTGPRACYDESKRYGETLCVNFAQQYGLPIKIARPFNNYGPGLKITDGRALPDFARNILEGQDIVLLSDGSPTRTFCYVSDAIIGYFKVLVLGSPGEPYNIGTEKPEISILELAKKCIAIGREMLSYDGDLRFLESSDAAYLIDNPNRRCPDISKARQQLLYRPSVGIDEGLRKSLLWYKDNHDTKGE